MPIFFLELKDWKIIFTQSKLGFLDLKMTEGAQSALPPL